MMSRHSPRGRSPRNYGRPYSRDRYRSPSRRYRSRSPYARRREPRFLKYPETSPCDMLGFFGLSSHTRPSDLQRAIETYAECKDVTILRDIKVSFYLT